MAKSVIIKVSFHPVETELIDEKYKAVNEKKISYYDFLDSEIPGLPGFKFDGAKVMPYRETRITRRFNDFFTTIVDGACVAAMGEPEDLILIIEKQ